MRGEIICSVLWVCVILANFESVECSSVNHETQQCISSGGGENETCFNGRAYEWEEYDEDNILGLDEGICNIDKVSSITNDMFLMQYAFDRPVIFTGVSDNTEFRRLTSRKALMEKYANNTITLSTANTHSYDKVDMSLKEYIERILKPQSVNKLGKDTLYFFGNNNYTEWNEIFKTYMQPPYSLPEKTGAYSFGIAAAGTGVPFHFHGPGFSEVIHGSKRWFLYPYEKMPKFDPDQNMLRWVLDEYPKLTKDNKPLECTIKPGDVLYFPDRWWHSTLNLKTSVFMSTFLG
ncbi:jmjC domain-containing protein 8-like [Styela clava]